MSMRDERSFKFFTFNEDAWSSFYATSNSKYVTTDTENSIVMYNDYIVLMDPRKRQRSFEAWFNYIKKGDASSWYSLQKASRLLRSNRLSSIVQQKADPREYRERDSIYMVKKYFTLGFHTVNPDEYHIIIASHKHIDVYKSKVILPSTYQTRYFPSPGEFERLFEKNSLKSEEGIIKRRQCRVCIMEPGDQYLIIAPHKCFFYFKICDFEELEDIVGVYSSFVGIQ